MTIKEPHSLYLEKKEYVSASDLRKLKKSPEYYKFIKYNPEQQQETQALLIGTAIHSYILEKESFSKIYTCLKKEQLPQPDKDYRVTANKEFREIFKKENKDKIVLDEADFNSVVQLCEMTVSSKPFLRTILETSENEISGYITDEKTGLKLKGRADCLPNDKVLNSCILDIKSTKSSNPYYFQRSIFDEGYDIQVGQYLKVFDKENFIFVAIEKEQPFQSSLLLLDQQSINICKENWRMHLDIYYWCLKNNYWADYCEFDLLKKLYKENVLFDTEISHTMNILNDFFEINNNTKGIQSLTLKQY